MTDKRQQNLYGALFKMKKVSAVLNWLVPFSAAFLGVDYECVKIAGYYSGVFEIVQTEEMLYADGVISAVTGLSELAEFSESSVPDVSENVFGRDQTIFSPVLPQTDHFKGTESRYYERICDWKDIVSDNNSCIRSEKVFDAQSRCFSGGVYKVSEIAGLYGFGKTERFGFGSVDSGNLCLQNVYLEFRKTSAPFELQNDSAIANFQAFYRSGGTNALEKGYTSLITVRPDSAEGYSVSEYAPPVKPKNSFDKESKGKQTVERKSRQFVFQKKPQIGSNFRQNAFFGFLDFSENAVSRQMFTKTADFVDLQEVFSYSPVFVDSGQAVFQNADYVSLRQAVFKSIDYANTRQALSKNANYVNSGQMLSQNADCDYSRQMLSQSADRVNSQQVFSQSADYVSSRQAFSQSADYANSQQAFSQSADYVNLRQAFSQSADYANSHQAVSQSADYVSSRQAFSQSADYANLQQAFSQSADYANSQQAFSQSADHVTSLQMIYQSTDNPNSKQAFFQNARAVIFQKKIFSSVLRRFPLNNNNSNIALQTQSSLHHQEFGSKANTQIFKKSAQSDRYFINPCQDSLIDINIPLSLQKTADEHMVLSNCQTNFVTGRSFFDSRTNFPNSADLKEKSFYLKPEALFCTSETEKAVNKFQDSSFYEIRSANGFALSESLAETAMKPTETTVIKTHANFLNVKQFPTFSSEQYSNSVYFAEKTEGVYERRSVLDSGAENLSVSGSRSFDLGSISPLREYGFAAKIEKELFSVLNLPDFSVSMAQEILGVSHTKELTGLSEIMPSGIRQIKAAVNDSRESENKSGKTEIKIDVSGIGRRTESAANVNDVISALTDALLEALGEWQ